MTVENNPIELKYLTELGFTVDCFDDNSGFWLNKSFKNSWLNNPTISIEDFNGSANISVDIEDNDYGLITIIEKKYSRKNLKKIIKKIK